MGIVLIRNSLLKLSRKLIKYETFSRSFEDDCGYLATFFNPQDDFERSYYQYKCQKRLYGSTIFFIMNILSLPVIVFLIIFSFRKKEIASKFKTAVFLNNGTSNTIIPKEIIDEYGEIENAQCGNLLTSKDLLVFWDVARRYPISWFFILKIILKVSYYRWVIEKYKPKAIVVCSEYSFTSSILTLFCEKNGVKHINIMHGEKIYDLRDSFFRFNKCYVWDEFYVELFKELRACDTQFIVAHPPALHFHSVVKKEYDYIYFLGDENDVLLCRVMESLRFLAEKGFKIAIRCHPRFTNKKIVYAICKEIDIIDPEKERIACSVLKTYNAISRFSTVLQQAYYNGVKIVIDDVTDNSEYQNLRLRKYIMMSREHVLLSSLLKK